MMTDTDVKEFKKSLTEFQKILDGGMLDMNNRLDKILKTSQDINKLLEHQLKSSTTELCPICNKPLYGTGKALTSTEDERTVHLACMISESCDCPHEDNGCHYSGYCEHRRAPNEDLNGTDLPTCGIKFPGKDE